MTVKFESVREEWSLEDDAGYQFHLIAEKDPEWGWNAQVTVGGLGAHGFKTRDDAVRYLCRHLERLRTIMKDKYPDEFK